jgi:hypothetical protein
MGVLANSISTTSFLIASSTGEESMAVGSLPKLDRLVSGKKMRSVIRLKQERPSESQKKLRHPNLVYLSAEIWK